MAKILIVEDEAKLAKLFADYLSLAYYETVILTRGDEVESWLSSNNCDLVLLDLMLPGKDGMDICKSIRKTSNLPIIITTARVEEIDRLLGLEIGADDYVCKPFSPREMVARVKAVLRRATLNSEPTKENIQQGQELKLEESKLKVIFKGSACVLTKVEFNLLKKLVDRPSHIFSRGQLMDSIYTEQHIVNDRTIDSHIKKIRKKLVAINFNIDSIHSVYGVGYKYETVE